MGEPISFPCPIVGCSEVMDRVTEGQIEDNAGTDVDVFYYVCGAGHEAWLGCAEDA
jgi:hypothetical protein